MPAAHAAREANVDRYAGQQALGGGSRAAAGAGARRSVGAALALGVLVLVARVASAADPIGIEAGDRAPAEHAMPVAPESPVSAVRDMQDAAAARLADSRGILFRVVPPRTPGPGIAVAPLPEAAPGGVAHVDAGVDGEGAEATYLADVVDRVPDPVQNLVFGTIHFGSRDEQGMAWVDLSGLLDGSRSLIVEAEAAQAWTAELDGFRLLPPGVRLSQLISRTEFEMALSLMPDFSREQIERLKPWAVLAVLEARGERPGGDGLDGGIVAAAQARGLPLLTLETLEDQLRALDCVHYTEQARVLEERLKAPWLLREMSDRALRHYHDRNLPGWLADVDRMIGLGPEGQAIERRARECLIEQRNARWMPALVARLREGGHFVAVGALHLVGEHGLLAELARAGFTVEIEPL